MSDFLSCYYLMRVCSTDTLCDLIDERESMDFIQVQLIFLIAGFISIISSAHHITKGALWVALRESHFKFGIVQVHPSLHSSSKSISYSEWYMIKRE